MKESTTQRRKTSQRRAERGVTLKKNRIWGQNQKEGEKRQREKKISQTGERGGRK